MKYLQVRIFALVLILVGAGLTYINWHELNSEGKYSLKLAAFAPLCVVGGIFMFFFPTKIGKPETVSDKIIVLVVFIVGIVAGLVNWYLMDPGFFGF
jgi:carbon starvation protein CstA